MKVLAIMGGPRKGYGTKIIERFEYELKLLQDIEFEYLYLNAFNLQMCRGCCNCFFKGENKCPVGNDDRNEIFDKMDNADGVIFMAPVYALHIPALMKNFFDRFSYIFHRPYFFGKIAMSISNHGISGSKKNNQYFNDVATSWGFSFVDQLGFSTMPVSGREKKMVKKMQKSCKTLLKALNGQRYHKPSLGEVLGFKIRKLLHNIGKDETNADYKYWFEQGWLEEERKYYYDVKIGIGKRIFAGLINALVKPQFKKMFSEGPKVVYKRYMKLESLDLKPLN